MPRQNPLADAVEAALLRSGGPFAMLTNPDGSVVSSSRAALGSLPGVLTTTEQRTSRRGTRNVSTSRAGAPPAAPRPAPAPRPSAPPAVKKAGPGVPGAKASPVWTANDQNEYRKAQEAVRALPPAAPKPRVVASPYDPAAADDLQSKIAAALRSAPAPAPSAPLARRAPGSIGRQFTPGERATRRDDSWTPNVSMGPAAADLSALLSQMFSPQPAVGSGLAGAADMLGKIMGPRPMPRLDTALTAGPPVSFRDVSAPVGEALIALMGALRNRRRPAPGTPIVSQLDELLGRALGEKRGQ